MISGIIRITKWSNLTLQFEINRQDCKYTTDKCSIQFEEARVGISTFIFKMQSEYPQEKSIHFSYPHILKIMASMLLTKQMFAIIYQ
jgi:hypothetical protein